MKELNYKEAQTKIRRYSKLERLAVKYMAVKYGTKVYRKWKMENHKKLQWNHRDHVVIFEEISVTYEVQKEENIL